MERKKKWTKEEKMEVQRHWAAAGYKGKGMVCKRCNDYFPEKHFRLFKNWKRRFPYCKDCSKTNEARSLLADIRTLKVEASVRSRTIRNRKLALEYLYEKQCQWCNSRAVLEGVEPLVRAPQNLYFCVNDLFGTRVSSGMAKSSEKAFKKLMEQSLVLCRDCIRERRRLMKTRTEDDVQEDMELGKLTLLLGATVERVRQVAPVRSPLQKLEKDALLAEQALDEAKRLVDAATFDPEEEDEE